MASSEALKSGLSSINGKLREKFRTSAFARSLAEGIGAGGILLLLLIGWMALRSDGTAQKMQDYIPVKTATIENLKGETSTASEKTAGDHTDVSASPKNKDALAAVPIAGLTQEYEDKLLPISRIEDDLTPFQAYKKPFVLEHGKALVSIVLVDFGLSASLSNSALQNLNDNISLVLNPYAPDPAKWGQQARDHGHEFWLSLPMETKNFTVNDTGPTTLMASAPIKENELRLFTVMSSAVGYAGLVSQKDHAFSAASIDPAPIMKQIFGRGLAFAESNPEIPAYGLSMAMEFGYPYVQNNFWLDADLRPDSIDRALQALEQQALKKGKAIAFMHPYPLAVNKVQAWLETASDKGLQIAPLSATVQ